ncbi:MAG: response regulator [Bacteroidota bacterium]|nr:response regulator [Bacteroidota bacterium]
MAKTEILIVEDENIVAKDIQNSLVKLGYIVNNVVSAGEKAIAAIEEKKPDIVMMDIMLKGKMSGIDAANIIKEKYQIPIIFLTAYADDDTIKKAKHAEPYGYIMKPFKEKELQTTIEMALYKHEQDLLTKKERDLFQSIVFNKDDKDSIYVRADYKLNRIKFTDVYYVEALKDYVTIHTADNSYTTHTTMKEMLRILPSNQFVRIHRSYIVRIDRIYSIKYPEMVIEGKSKVLPIGGLYRKELYSKLNLL